MLVRKWQPSQKSLGPLGSGLPPALALSSSGCLPRLLSSLLVAGFSSLSSWQRSASEAQNGMSANHRLGSDRATEALAPRRKSDATESLPSLRPRVKACSLPLDDDVFRISSTFYSACQALCFIFPIALPEINQSNTWSKTSGIEKTVHLIGSP